MSGLETAALVSSVIGGAVAASQANQSAKAQIQANNQAYAMQAEQARLANEIEQRRRKEALEAGKATRRARFGAAGIGSADGSAAALIDGLQTRSARRGKEAARQRVLGLQANLLDVQSRNKMALLRAAHAREKALLNIGTSAAKAAVGAIGGPPTGGSGGSFAG